MRLFNSLSSHPIASHTGFPRTSRQLKSTLEMSSISLTVSGDPGPPGGDCVGVVTLVELNAGHGVEDCVFGLAPGSSETQINASEGTLVKMPPPWLRSGSHDAHGVMTTHIALHVISKAEQKDQILVCTAAGQDWQLLKQPLMPELLSLQLLDHLQNERLCGALGVGMPPVQEV